MKKIIFVVKLLHPAEWAGYVILLLISLFPDEGKCEHTVTIMLLFSTIISIRLWLEYTNPKKSFSKKKN